MGTNVVKMFDLGWNQALPWIRL